MLDVSCSSPKVLLRSGYPLSEWDSFRTLNIRQSEKRESWANGPLLQSHCRNRDGRALADAIPWILGKEGLIVGIAEKLTSCILDFS